MPCGLAEEETRFVCGNRLRRFAWPPAAGAPPDRAAGGAAQATIFVRLIRPALALLSGTTKTLFTPAFETSIPCEA